MRRMLVTMVWLEVCLVALMSSIGMALARTGDPARTLSYRTSGARTRRRPLSSSRLSRMGSR